MAGDRVLTQEEIDSVFQKTRDTGDDDGKNAQPYDFRRPDRIAKDQLRAIHLLHENFSRSLASSLSAYLRAYVAVNLVSVEQLAFMEFTQTLASPTFLVALGHVAVAVGYYHGFGTLNPLVSSCRFPAHCRSSGSGSIAWAGCLVCRTGSPSEV